MSLSPPRKPNIGDVWADPFTAERYVYTGTDEPFVGASGVHLDVFDGWELWELVNERYEYDRHDSHPFKVQP